MLFCFTKTLVGGCPRTPERPSRAMFTGAEAPGQDHHGGAHSSRGHRQPFDRRERASTRFRISIIRREDVELLGRKPETGGTPTLLGVEFVRYGGSYGLGFRQTAPQTRRMAVRAVSGLDRVVGGA